MSGDKCILQLRGLPPFLSPKYDLKKHPNYRYTAEADKTGNAFQLDRLINRMQKIPYSLHFSGIFPAMKKAAISGGR